MRPFINHLISNQLMVNHQVFEYKESFKLESGAVLPGFELHFTLYGKLNEDASNVIWVCHALTGSSDFTQWWDGLFGKGKTYNPENYLIVCANTLGGNYGSTGPLTENPVTGKPYYHSFPFITNRDVVNSFDLLRQHLGINQIHTLIGGSLGGQQALEWAVNKPEVFNHLILIASNAQHSPWGIAFNETQRLAIDLDPTWIEDHPMAGMEGMKVARATALISYRNYNTYRQTQSEENEDIVDGFRAASYQKYQGEKLASRFNAFTYWTLSKAMDAHNVGRGRGGVQNALSQLKAITHIIGVDSDILFPLREQIFLNKHIEGSSLDVIRSEYGHDGFLVETDQITKSIKEFYKRSVQLKEKTI